MEINRSNILQIVNNSNARPDKDYGQNFLVEPDICKRIVESLDSNNNDKVLEIGPGLGSLTNYLYTKTNDLTIVDIDERMIAFLKLVYGNNGNINIIQEDIRKHDVSSYTRILGNLPYNITSETIVYLLLNASKAKKMVLMVQSDAFSHFFDIQGKEYGPSSVLLHLLGDCKRLFNVKPGSFYPSPKCGSTVFEINISPICELEEAKKVFSFAKSLFINRRKTISNNLMNVIKNKETTNELLAICNIEVNKRPEELPPIKYLELFRRHEMTLSK